jgi:hypothetical protein
MGIGLENRSIFSKLASILEISLENRPNAVRTPPTGVYRALSKRIDLECRSKFSKLADFPEISLENRPNAVHVAHVH